jgi:alcohol dehydrogenase (cytochrome c)
MNRRTLLIACLIVIPAALRGQVSYERLLRAADEPKNWLTYSGAYASQRYSLLTQISTGNVKNLKLNWVHQTLSTWVFETTPLVVDSIMYFTQGPNDIVALDAKSGRVFWIYHYTPLPNFKACCGAANRGLAVLGDTLFMGTVDAHLIAIDAKTGQPQWKTKVADTSAGYAISLAPLVIKDKVLIGNTGGDMGTRGFVAAYDARTGREVWRFHTIPSPGEPGSETWPSPEWSERGGGSVWVTGSFDPALNLTYWGTGNPGLDFNPSERPGDNLYSDSVVALDADTGRLKWHFQFTPNDAYDYDAAQVPVLVDMLWDNRPRHLMLWGNRNGFFYVLDRTDGKFLGGSAFTKVNWASGLDKAGRPIQTRQPEGKPTYPCLLGGTSWHSPSFSPRTELFYLTIFENCREVFVPEHQEYRRGEMWLGRKFDSRTREVATPTMQGGPVYTGAEDTGTGAIIAIEPRTGRRRWTFPMANVSMAGNLTTASDLLFSGSREGHFHALDARTGAELWKASLGADIKGVPITYEVEGKQHVAVAAGQALFDFALPD